MKNKHILAVIGLVIVVSAGGSNVFAGAFQQLAGGPNFDGSAMNNAPVVSPVSADGTALTSNAAVEARVQASKSMGSQVPTLAAQVESTGNRSAESVGSGPSEPSFHPIEALRSVFHTISPALVCGGAGAFIGWAIAGTIAGAMTGGLLFAAFALLAII